MATLPLRSRDSIEIRELVVRANVRSEPQRGSGEALSADQLDAVKKEVIAESVEKVLSIIQNKNER
jgi:hypothetical protein